MPLLGNCLQVSHERRPKSAHLNLLSKALCSKAHLPIPTETQQSSLCSHCLYPCRSSCFRGALPNNCPPAVWLPSGLVPFFPGPQPPVASFHLCLNCTLLSICSLYPPRKLWIGEGTAGFASVKTCMWSMPSKCRTVGSKNQQRSNFGIILLSDFLLLRENGQKETQELFGNSPL